MIARTISVVAMSDKDFPNLEAKLRVAGEWMRIAASEGAQLVVFPEVMNRYRGGGPESATAVDFEKEALTDWEAQTKTLVDAARSYQLDVVVPVTHFEAGRLHNSFFLISRQGTVLGRFDKLQPTSEELALGMKPGRLGIISWQGIKLGGAICFDTNFENIFRLQADLGAQMYIVPSLWPGGTQLNAYAVRYVAPIALAYPAWSRIIDIDGTEIVAGGYRLETLRFGFGSPVYTTAINFNRVVLHADGNAEKIAEIQRQFGSRIRIQFQQENCRFVLESRCPGLSIDEIVDSYSLIDIRTYLNGFAWAKSP